MICQTSGRGKSSPSCVKTTVDGGRANTTERSGGFPTTTSRYSDSLQFRFQSTLKFGSIWIRVSRRLFPLSSSANKSGARTAMWPRHGSANDPLPQQRPLPVFPCLPGYPFSKAFSLRVFLDFVGIQSLYPVVCLTNKCLHMRGTPFRRLLLSVSSSTLWGFRVFTPWFA